MNLNNDVKLIGRLTRDPELRQTQEGTSVLSFSLAVRKGYTPKDGEPDANFIDCVAWRQTAEFIGNYGLKGRLLAVNGELQPRSYTDKDGVNRRVVEVIVDRAEFLDSKSGGSPSGSRNDGVNAPAEDDSDLPF